MKVEIFSYENPDSKKKLLCTWMLSQDGIAFCDSPNLQSAAEELGEASGGRRYYPKDGEAFLRALPIAYSSSTFVAAILTE
jgi:hypothetical protein